MSSTEVNPNKQPRTPLFQISRFLYIAFSWTFLVCILVQVLLAGTAIFTNVGGWGMHKDLSSFLHGSPLFCFCYLSLEK